ncbi:MAG TPA: urate hydroxylase PuuD [Acidimicrobiales bacterium]|nr:urate hydroxylase PuuD [Acidimicrobiales bacterium]
MKLAVIFDNFFDPGSGLDLVARWLHVLAGIAWIGLLYFFNFVQTPSFAELSPGARNEAFDKLTWRALWWFRWAAMATFLMGLVLLGLNASSDDTFWGGKNYLATARGTAILTGILFGLTMLGNVWMIIWPNQQIVIGSVRKQLAGGEADPEQPNAAKRGARASRANTFFSVTMLWFMVFAAHFASAYSDVKGDLSNVAIYWLVVIVLWAFVEASALGYIGGLDNAFNKLVFDDHRRTIIYAFVYWAVIFFIGWEVLLKNV